jgi:hypothetical protein
MRTGQEGFLCDSTSRVRFAALEVILGAPTLPPSRPDAFHARSILGDSIQPKEDGAIWTNSIDHNSHLYGIRVIDPAILQQVSACTANIRGPGRAAHIQRPSGPFLGDGFSAPEP